MAKKTRKWILGAIVLIVLVGGAIGLYFYNKGPVDVKNSQATGIAATTLYDSFVKDSSGSLEEYTGRILSVQGRVQSVSQNQQKETVILLKTNSDGGYINCTMEEIKELPVPETEVNIKGICSGMGQGDAELGIMGDVYLTRGYLMKNN